VKQQIAMFLIGIIQNVLKYKGATLQPVISEYKVNNAKNMIASRNGLGHWRYSHPIISAEIWKRADGRTCKVSGITGESSAIGMDALRRIDEAFPYDFYSDVEPEIEIDYGKPPVFK
jgi:hypothetical protein